MTIFLAIELSYGQDTLQIKKTAAADTSAIVKKDSATIVKANAVDTTKHLPLPGAMTKKEEDTTSLFLKTQYFNFGVGWDIGSYDILSEWQKNLPDSVQNILPINPDTLGFTIKEPVNSYNVMFPISFSYTPFVYTRSSLGFEGSFSYIGKTLQAELIRDTTKGKIDYSQSMTAMSVSVGVIYRRALNEKYFKIEGADRTSFLFGVYALPIIYISREYSLKPSGDVGDSVMAAANSRITNLYARGLGAAWRLGICSQKALSRASGFEVAISYIGRYSGYFRQGGRLVNNKDINPAAEHPDDKLSFFSNMVEIKLEVLIGVKPKEKK